MEKQLNKRQQQHQETLERIREAVDGLGKTVSLESMTVRDICKEAGITVGTFYHYFPSKLDLLLDRNQRINEYFDVFGEQVLITLEPEEAIAALTMEFVKYLYSRVFPIMLAFHIAVVENKDNKFTSSTMLKWSKEVIQRGQESGAFRRDLELDILVELYMIQIHGLIVNYCIRKGNGAGTSPVNQLLIQSICDFLRPVT